MSAEWDQLDNTAEANLTDLGNQLFHSYKKELMGEGLRWEEAEEILRGWLWDESEAEEHENER